MGMGETVADQQYANILLASLPSCYDMPVCAITTNADDAGKDIDPAKIVKHISDGYDKRMLSKSKPDDQAFTASTQFKKKDKRNLDCFNCKKTGHIKADCWAKGGGKEGQRPQCGKKRDDKDKSTDNAASATDTGDDIESWAVLVEDSEEDLPFLLRIGNQKSPPQTTAMTVWDDASGPGASVAKIKLG